ncbi:MAG: hypothetical protein AAF234_07835 [Pseudomonadota bacterium]
MNKVSRAIGTYVAVRVGGKCHALIGKAPPRASMNTSIGRQPSVSTLATESCYHIATTSLTKRPTLASKSDKPVSLVRVR